MHKNFNDIQKRHEACFAVCSPTRLKIIAYLRSNPAGSTVREIARKLGFSMSRTSHQLAILKKHNVTEAVRKGREKIYSISDSRVRAYLPCWYLAGN
ncbi:MAG: metalloregulator ArsR/SmtB family transcription factor [Patescibacteria group bacterium]